MEREPLVPRSFERPRSGRAKRGRRRRRWLLAPLVLFALVGFGVSERDAADLRAFADAARRWQAHPEFRSIALQYATLGSAATRTRPFGVPSERVIMGVRSIPGLPKEVAVTDTSAAHYAGFGRGPLSAYLHLCSEQDVPAYVSAVEQVGMRTGRTDADLYAWLDARRMDYPIVKDAGAVRSLGALLADADAARPFTVRGDVRAPLAPHIAALAASLNIPPDPARMTPAEQQVVLDRLDGHVRRHDVELWRTKQVSDFCGGLWAQVFGPPYNQLLVPYLYARAGGQVAFVALLGWLAFAPAVRRRMARQRRGPRPRDHRVARVTV